jgi:hypothetical protein
MKSIAELFANLDDLHFAGRLQRAQWQIKLAPLHPLRENDTEATFRNLHHKVWGCTLPAKRLIILDPRLLGFQPVLRVALLHEMLHARFANDGSTYSVVHPHGEEFLMELKRLRREGEEHLRREIRYYSMARASGSYHLFFREHASHRSQTVR